MVDSVLFLWGLMTIQHYQMSHITRKCVFGVFDQVRLKLACSATETSQSLELLGIASIHIILSKQQTAKVLIRLHRCAGWSAPLLFAYGIRHIFAWPGPDRYGEIVKSQTTWPSISRTLLSYMNLITWTYPQWETKYLDSASHHLAMGPPWDAWLFVTMSFHRHF